MRRKFLGNPEAELRGILLIKLIKPTTKILAISGYSRYIAGKDEIKADGFLRKPFKFNYLLSTVRRILDTEKIDI